MSALIRCHLNLAEAQAGTCDADDLYVAQRGGHDAAVMNRMHVNGADLEVEVRGHGDPVLFVQTALVADELVPIARQAVLGDNFQIVYHRRGYCGSSPVDGTGSIVEAAADAAALLDALGTDGAHRCWPLLQRRRRHATGIGCSRMPTQPDVDRATSGARPQRGGLPSGERRPA